jgi:hypothetical protein
MPNPEPRKLSLFQFSLRHLLIATLVAAIFAWLLTVLEPDLWLIFLFPTLPIVASSASILGAIYLRGRWRAFSVGFCTGLAHVLVLAFMTEFYRMFRGPREWEIVVIVPFFVLVVPGITGWIGHWFYRLANPEQAAVAASAQTPTTPLQRDQVIEIRSAGLDTGCDLEHREQTPGVPLP